MKESMFSSLVSITKGLHREKRSEKEFQLLLSNLKGATKADNAVFKVNFKRPLNSKKEYYQKCIFNETENIIASFMADFPDNATIAENQYSYTILNNKFDKYLNDISAYISTRNIGTDLSNDDNYIINYLKISAIRLYAELQEQYGQFSNRPLFTISELAEKYFNEDEFDNTTIVNVEESKNTSIKKVVKTQSKPKTTFGYTRQDPDWLFKILNKLQLSIDLLDVKTDVKDLQSLLLSKDYSDLKKEIYLDCKTTEFKYVVKQLQPYFKNLTPTLIESTGLFYTKSGKPLTAHNLYTKGKAPLKKEIIDNIFKQIQ